MLQAPERPEEAEFRVGTIRAVEDVAGSERLVALKVDLGDHERTIVWGLERACADLQALVGQRTLFVIT